MARRATGKRPYSIYPDRGVAFINTRIAGQRIRESLGVPYNGPERSSARDVRAAEEAAAKRYAELVAGRALDSKTPRVLTAHTLHELIAMWLVEAKKLYPETFKLMVIHARHFETFAADEFTTFDPDAEDAPPRWVLDRRVPLERLVVDTGPQSYATERLAGALRTTIRKEISTLFTFLGWAKAEGHIADLPPRPKLPRNAMGKRTGPQRAVPVHVTHPEALAIIAELPEWAARGGRAKGKQTARSFRVRDRAAFAYETALRPGTVSRLTVPRHWAPGASRLLVTADIDKGRNERYVPLTAAALAILERVAPTEGPVFGDHDISGHLKAAALKVLPAEKAARFAAYDLRHGKAKHMLSVSGGELLGTAHQLGHRRVTTTNRYLRTDEQSAEAVVRALDSVSKRSAGESMDPKSTCEGRDLNPHASYGASTSREPVSEFSEESANFGAPTDGENAEILTAADSVWSASGQQAVLDAQRGLVLQEMIWGDLDAAAMADELGIELPRGRR